ncbi:hypothetical protein TNCV_2505561 [Trichonephila clavipes]|uniref:Uncharacterized protein n=1 Tax=Trichonephila clavipes TaxID=2585209 RepID=A0A8X6WFT3_TRICX|nr:hypothetical protein TNCV_2505561 [Trichonephila clavipes]
MRFAANSPRAALQSEQSFFRPFVGRRKQNATATRTDFQAFSPADKHPYKSNDERKGTQNVATESRTEEDTLSLRPYLLFENTPQMWKIKKKEERKPYLPHVWATEKVHEIEIRKTKDSKIPGLSLLLKRILLRNKTLEQQHTFAIACKVHRNIPGTHF